MQKLKSRKFWAGLGAAVAVCVLTYLGIDESGAQHLVILALGYMGAQGYVDSKKP